MPRNDPFKTKEMLDLSESLTRFTEYTHYLMKVYKINANADTKSDLNELSSKLNDIKNRFDDLLSALND